MPSLLNSVCCNSLNVATKLPYNSTTCTPTVGAVFKSVPPVLSIIVQATSRSEAEWTVRTWSSCVPSANSRPTALWIINTSTAPVLVDLSIFRPTSLFSLSFYTFIKLLQHISPPPPPPPPPYLLRKLKATLQRPDIRHIGILGNTMKPSQGALKNFVILINITAKFTLHLSIWSWRRPVG